MKYEQIRNLPNESFRRLTGVKRQTFEKMVKILAEDDKNKKINRERAGTGRSRGLQFRKKSNLEMDVIFINID